ncbi:MAG: hypothetical protein M1827_003433 [Pycnora praestabilis]|nr:MAG: hypothetical protein M1827_003433 [Pycnora praestabilis]
MTCAQPGAPALPGVTVAGAANSRRSDGKRIYIGAVGQGRPSCTGIVERQVVNREAQTGHAPVLSVEIVAEEGYVIFAAVEGRQD